MKRETMLLLAAVLVVIAVVALWRARSSGSGAERITAEQAKQQMDAGGVTVVDVRTAGEFAAGHIAHAVLVPNESIGAEPPAALPDKSAHLLVYCRSGARSRQAAAKLVRLGYEHVQDFGGIIDWPYKTVRGK